MVGVGVTLGVTVMVGVAVWVGVAVRVTVAVEVGGAVVGLGSGVAGSHASMESEPLQPLIARASSRLIHNSAWLCLIEAVGLCAFAFRDGVNRIGLILLRSSFR
jgi:hypothetical protein